MGISLNPEHLKRYKDIGALFLKYGRSDLVKSAGLEDAILLDEDENPETALDPAPNELAKDLEAMGPAYIKLGQLLSTRADLIPAPYLESLSRLQDDVAPIPFEQIEEAITSELGVRLSKAFAEFDPKPIAAASLGQVHRAEMRDGRLVVVKVQRPDIRNQIAQDFETLSEIAQFLDSHTQIGKRYEFQRILSEFRKSLLHELDYRIEARNLITIGNNLADIDLIVVPSPIEDYTTSRVLTMEYVHGQKVTSLSPLAYTELDGAVLAEQLFHAYLQQILVDGVFHADPHPGNVFLTDQEQIALLDLGMVGQVLPEHQDNLLQLLLAISEGVGDKAAQFTIKLGEAKPDFDEAKFSREISDLVVRHKGANMEEINTGRIILEITRIAGESNFRMPAEFTMVAKTLLNLDQIVHILDPSFDPKESIRQNALIIMEQRLARTLSPGALLRLVVETKSLLEKLPDRINKFLDLVSNNQLKLTIDAIDEKLLLEAFQKIANRITLGLVIAS
ncbi:MAG TPA: AarF/UbiB family protein, partial [Pyrinomonadaceae bacterium]|nr:AarF/UbiB family protein [Pyrinomonadaceae bacterium]